MIGFIQALNGWCNGLQAPLAFIGRLLLAFIFLDSGIDKIPNYAHEVQFMTSHGVSPLFLVPVILLEIGGGAALVVGLLTRYAALALAVFSVIAAVLFFPDYMTNDDQWISFTSNLAIAGGLLVLMAFGPGAWSADAQWLKDHP